jgi:hypothetical protein
VFVVHSYSPQIVMAQHRVGIQQIVELMNGWVDGEKIL